MKKEIIKGLLFTSVLMIGGCGGGTTDTVIDNPNISVDSTTSILTQELKDSLTFMYSEEGLAYDVYMNIYKFHIDNNIPTSNILENIANGEQSGSEEKHIAKVNELAIKYDLNITQYPDTGHPYSTDDLDRYGSGEYPVNPIQELYNMLYDKGTVSKTDALEVGCMVEVIDIDDLNEYIKKAKEANAPDLEDAFIYLQKGSYSHYQAFDDGLRKMGINNGCCSVKTELLNPNTSSNYIWCHPEYIN